MIVADKVRFLSSNYPREWREAHTAADDEVSRQHSMFCVCGKLCTGLHETYCTRFKQKVNSNAVKRLAHLLPKKGETVNV